MKGKNFPLKKGDIFIFTGIILLMIGISVYLFSQKTDGQKYCIISQNHVIIKKVPLSEGRRQTFTVSGDYQNQIEIDGLRVRMVHSDCPNQFCVHTGWIEESYQTIACLPNQLLIQIVSQNSGEVDAIS